MRLDGSRKSIEERQSVNETMRRLVYSSLLSSAMSPYHPQCVREQAQIIRDNGFDPRPMYEELRRIHPDSPTFDEMMASQDSNPPAPSLESPDQPTSTF